MARTTGGSGFKMRSGNKPSFAKMSGARISNSPANLNSFGFAKGTSPLDWDPTGKSEEEIKARQKEIGVAADGIWGPKSKAADVKHGETETTPDQTDFSISESENMIENVDTSKQSKVGGDGGGKGQGWKQAAGLIGSMLTGGLDAVYGSGKVVPMSDRLLKKDKTIIIEITT